MPSSMIFTGLVVLWLIVLVPTIARRRQEVERPSAAALSGRVLARPQRQNSVEVGRMTVHEEVRTVQDIGLGAEPVGEAGAARVPAARSGEEPTLPGPRGLDDRPGASGPDVRAADHEADGTESAEEPVSLDDRAGGEVTGDRAAQEVDDRAWERPPSRYRPGRGGFDADAAFITARARYAFRQRVVLALLIGAVATGVIAAVSLTSMWWAHGALDLLLVGYLGYLRRQVRMEDAIRSRRAARVAGSRPDDRATDAWAGSGRGAAARAALTPDEGFGHPREGDGESGDFEEDDVDSGPVDRPGSSPRGEEPEPERVAGTGEPVGLLRVLPETLEQQTALPRLLPVPPPPLPAGTALVEADDADLALPEIALPHRRAVGE